MLGREMRRVCPPESSGKLCFLLARGPASGDGARGEEEADRIPRGHAQRMPQELPNFSCRTQAGPIPLVGKEYDGVEAYGEEHCERAAGDDEGRSEGGRACGGRDQ